MSSHFFLHWNFSAIHTIHILPDLALGQHQDVSLHEASPGPLSSLSFKPIVLMTCKAHPHGRHTLWRHLSYCNLLCCNLILYDYFTFHVFLSYLSKYIINSLSRDCTSYFFIVLSVLALPLAHEKFFPKSSTFKALALITSSLRKKKKKKKKKSDKGGWGEKVREKKERGWGKAKNMR